MAKVLIKIDKNGSKHYEGDIICDRCGGQGGSEAWNETGYTCYKCGGTGTVWGKWIERTPEYEAKLQAKREARAKARQAEWEAQEAQRKLAEEIWRKEKEAKEARIKAQKAISQYVGEIGQKIEVIGTYQYTAHWTTHIGWMEQTMYCHNFKDPDGNVLIWKTQKGVPFHYGEPVNIRGTVKDHSEYEDEKQTVLTRCKIELAQ